MDHQIGDTQKPKRKLRPYPPRTRAQHHKYNPNDLCKMLWRMYMQDIKQFRIACHRKLWPPKHFPEGKEGKKDKQGNYIVTYNVEDVLRWCYDVGYTTMSVDDMAQYIKEMQDVYDSLEKPE